MELPALILLWFCLVSSLICPIWSKTNLTELGQTKEKDDGVEKTHHSKIYSDILKSIITNTSYDKSIRPDYDGPAIEIGVNMYIMDMSLSDIDQELTVIMYFREIWTDRRLAFENVHGIEELAVEPEFIKNIWTPDTFFANARESSFHTVLKKNEFLRIDRSGNIATSVKLTVKFSCPMNFDYFPMDKQICSLVVESYGYKMKDVKYKWKDEPNPVAYYIYSSPEFWLSNITTRNDDLYLPEVGNYSRLECQLVFHRYAYYYIMNYYVPATIILILSWATFWLNHQKAATTRVMLSAMGIFGIIYLKLSVNSSLPKVPYLKSIDIYLETCLLMVFASLLEYITIDYTTKRFQVYKERILNWTKRMEYWKLIDHFLLKSTNQDPTPRQMKNEMQNWPHSEETTTYIPENMNLIGDHDDEKLADKYSRVVFPILFVCFNLLPQ